MAITAKILDSDLTELFDFVYDASTQPYYHSRKGLQITSEDTDVLQHRPDDGQPVPIRANDRDRTAFIDLDVLGADEDEVSDKIIALKRVIDGEHQTALRYHLEGDVNQLYLKMQRGNATNYTLQPIKWGHVDDSGSHYTAAAQNTGYAIGIRITLHLAPYGEGAAITLRNDLASSPHFLEDSNSDGLADGMVSIGAATTYSLATSSGNIVVGPSSQKFNVNDASFNGFETDPVTASTSSTAVAYCWIRSDSALYDPVTIQLMDGSANLIDQEVFDPASPADYDNTFATAGGTTFYRYVVSGSNTTAANFKLRVARLGADASIAGSYFVSGMYLQTGTTTAPSGLAWCSTAAIQNRYDPTSSNEGRINYIDVWGVPGDSDAIVDMASTVTTATSSPGRLIISRIFDTKTLAANRLYWFDTLSAGGVLNGSFSTPSDANRSGGGYLRFTSTGAGSGTFSISLVDDDGLIDFLRWPSRIYILSRSSNTASTIAADTIAGGSTIVDSGLGYTAANTWEFIDAGLLVPNSAPLAYANTGGTPTISFSLATTTTSVTVDIDAIIAMPITDDGFLVGQNNGSSFTATDIFYVLGSVEQYFSDNGGSSDNQLGVCWTCRAGNIMNRYIFNMTGFSNGHALTNAWTTALTITPRTRHLLGTL